MLHLNAMKNDILMSSRSPSRRIMRSSVQSAEEKVKPSTRTPRTHDNKVTSLGSREPRRAWDKSPIHE